MQKAQRKRGKQQITDMEYRIYDELVRQAMDIRTAVFIEEQGFHDEFDEIDKIAKHIVVYDGENAVATARFFTDDGGVEYHIGRLAVVKSHRKLGLGKEILNRIEKAVQSYGGKRIALSAQVRASGFYEKNGYKKTGSTYLDEYCPHIRMIKEL